MIFYVFSFAILKKAGTALKFTRPISDRLSRSQQQNIDTSFKAGFKIITGVIYFIYASMYFME